MLLRIVLAVAALALGALGFKLAEQGDRIDRLEGELAALRKRVNEPSPIAAAPAPPTYVPVPRPAAPAAAPVPEAPPEQPPAPRVPVTQAEIDHVESAVLSLLEADRPELREKLRAVVQDEQRSLEQAEREERRERWATRREARLLEVGSEIGLTADQRNAILQIMLGTRDQIADIRENAATPDAINRAREQSRALREQHDAQIKELMTPQQYEKFQQSFGDDDDGPRGPRGPRPER